GEPRGTRQSGAAQTALDCFPRIRSGIAMTGNNNMANGEEDDIPATSSSPDASLTQDDNFTVTSHAGLAYPWGDAAPAAGETIRIANGISWARIPMPGSLGHINSWLLDDADE